MHSETFLLDTRDGERVVVHRWEPSGRVRGAVNIAHGLAEHAARYATFAETLTAEGYAVYAEDHRGHGATVSDPDDLGLLAPERGWARLLDDVHRVGSRARTDHPDVPLVLLGHSMGSFVAQQVLFTFPGSVDGAVLSGPSGAPGPLLEAAAVLARVERRRLGPRGRSRLLDQLTFGAYNRRFAPTRTRFDWLSRDTGRVDAYVDDPRCGFTATTQLYVDMFAGLRVIGQVERVRAGAPSELPVLVIAGSEDPVGGGPAVSRLVRRYEGAGLTRVEHRVYEGARHELLNESNRDEVVADIVAWLGRHSGPPASG